MAFEEGITFQQQTFEASGDLSASQYCAMKVDTNGRVALAGEGDKVAGVLQDKPAALGRAAAVAIGGSCKALAGGTITAGDRVAVAANGKFTAVGSGDDWSFGIARNSTTTGLIFTILIQPTGPQGL